MFDKPLLKILGNIIREGLTYFYVLALNYHIKFFFFWNSDSLILGLYIYSLGALFNCDFVRFGIL